MHISFSNTEKAFRLKLVGLLVKHTLVGTVYRQDSKMNSAVLKSVEVLQTITAQAVQEEDVRAVTQKTGSKNSRLEVWNQMFPHAPCPDTCVTELR